VVLIDSNQTNIKKANDLGLEAISTNIYSDSLVDNIELNDIGYLMALTGNSDINKFAINKFSKQFGENGSFRLAAKEEMLDDQNNLKEGLFSQTDDYNSLSEVTRKFPSIQEIKLVDKEHYLSLIETANNDKDIIPLFVKDDNGELHVISLFNKQEGEFQEGSVLVYLGKPFIVENI
jgi:hypothetical protein